MKFSLRNLLSKLTVEPAAIFLFVGYVLYKTASDVIKYDVICFQQYTYDVSVDCTRLKLNKDAKDHVQKINANWDMYSTMAYLIPAIFMAMVLGAWSDKHGRKVNMLLGTVGIIIAQFGYTIFSAFPTIPLWFMPLIGAASGFTGMNPMIEISCYSYIADTSVDKRIKNIKMILFAVCHQFATIIAGLMGGALLPVLSIAWVLVIGITFEMTLFAYIMARIPQIPPNLLKQIAYDRAGRNSETLDLMASELSIPGSKHHWSLLQGLRNIYCLQRQAISTYIRPREGNNRLYVMLSVLVYFLYRSAEIGARGSLGALYAYTNGWDGSMVSYWKSTQSASLLVGNVIGIVLLRSKLLVSDTMIITLSCASLCLEVFTLSLVGIFPAYLNVFMFLATALGLFSSLGLPTLKVFVSEIVRTDEVGKIFICFSLASDFAHIWSSTVYNRIYEATVNIFPSTLYLVMSCVLLLCSICFGFIHRHMSHNKLKK